MDLFEFKFELIGLVEFKNWVNVGKLFKFLFFIKLKIGVGWNFVVKIICWVWLF